MSAVSFVIRDYSDTPPHSSAGVMDLEVSSGRRVSENTLATVWRFRVLSLLRPTQWKSEHFYLPVVASR